MATIQEAQDKLDEAQALLSQVVVTEAPVPCWPAATDCLGGTTPGLISIPSGDGDPTGKMGEPGYSRRLMTMPDGSIGVFGDSIIQMTQENKIHPAAVNYALGGQSLRRMINALQSMSFMHSAGAGVMMCGVNDLSNISYYGDRSNGQAAQTVVGMYANQLKNWMTGKWVIYHLLPCDEITAGSGATGYNAQVAYVNAHLADAMAGCAAQIVFVPVRPEYVDAAGNLKSIYHLGDGQHPSKLLADCLAEDGAAALASLGL